MKRFKHLKPIKAKGVFYDAKNTTGMRFKQKTSNAVVYVILTIISLIWILNYNKLTMSLEMEFEKKEVTTKNINKDKLSNLGILVIITHFIWLL